MGKFGGGEQGPWWVWGNHGGKTGFTGEFRWTSGICMGDWGVGGQAASTAGGWGDLGANSIHREIRGMKGASGVHRED